MHAIGDGGRLDRSLVDQGRQISAGADPDCGAVGVERACSNSTGVEEAAFNRDRLAGSPDPKPLSVDACVNARGFDGAAIDQTVCIVARSDRVQGDGAGAGADQNGGRATE
ncbi:hypothetical protein D3C85_1395580 [compost metagenome]